ncbi:hypothetical protein [Rufibacter ruber]|uniref:hypothetical protein n=1 Tax=Rufibacter ruber TaxID=1783499 RepID=UPI00129081A2|nr:hypothetical protein [Rufibacter ruber]
MAEQTNKEILSALLSGLPEKARTQVRGILTLQIMVEENGSSCLVSLRNETNYTTRKWHLPENISQRLTWHHVKKKVSVVLAVKFSEKGAQFLRYGIEGLNREWKPIKTW